MRTHTHAKPNQLVVHGYECADVHISGVHVINTTEAERNESSVKRTGQTNNSHCEKTRTQLRTDKQQQQQQQQSCLSRA